MPARIVFNRFVSAISFKPTIATVLSPDVRPQQAGFTEMSSFKMVLSCLDSVAGPK